MVIGHLVRLGLDMGWDVEVLTTNPMFQRELRKQGAGVVALHGISRAIRLGRDLACLLRLRSFLAGRRYDMVHTHTSKAGVLGRLAARIAGVPAIIHTAHGFAFHEGSSWPVVRSCALLENIAARCCDRIITVSRFHRSWALALGIAGEDKIVAIPNGIPPERVSVVTGRAAVRARLGVDPEEFVILSTGRLAPQKGLESLIEAVPRLETELGRSFSVWLVGEGTLEPALRSMVAQRGLSARIRFLGFRNDIGDLLAAADLVALPTLREGLSIALLEAMAAGKPVVTTTIGSNREATGDGACALLVPPKNTAKLAAGICRLARSPELAAQFAREAHHRYLSHYTLDRMVANYGEEYDLLLRKVHRRSGELALAAPTPPVARQ